MGNSKTLQASHLCHNPLCTIPAHVILESVVDNNNRKGCQVWVDCPHCELKIFCCKHRPACVKFCPGYETLEEFLDWGIHRV